MILVREKYLISCHYIGELNNDKNHEAIMPQLIPIIEIGFCSGYGDGDYRVSCRDLTRAELNELIVTTHYALQQLVDNFKRNQPQEQACQTPNQ